MGVTKLYTVTVINLAQPLSSGQPWSAGSFSDYADAVETAHIFIDNVLLHLDQGFREKGISPPASDLLTAFLDRGEAPIVMRDDGTAAPFDFWGYVVQSADRLCGGSGESGTEPRSPGHRPQ